MTAFSTVNGDGDAEAAANVAAEAIGKATAEAYASAEITLTVEGDGEAEGVALASAEAIAEATATVRNAAVWVIHGKKKHDLH